jgi:Na+:H+ antiporter, NhaC family
VLEPVVARAGTRSRLILTVNGSGVGMNVVAGDQYVADVPTRMLPDEFARRGRAPQVFSRAVEDSGTVISVLSRGTPAGPTSRASWRSTAAYLLSCFFDVLSPVLDVIYGFLGRKVPQTSPEEPAHGPPSTPTAAT